METLAGVHHFYGGMGLALLGYLMIAGGRRRWIAFGQVLVIAGALIMVDDIWQHGVQYVRQENYASPCKRIYHSLSPRCAPLRATVAAADRLFRAPVKNGKTEQE